MITITIYSIKTGMRKISGLTLIELLVTIAVATILFSLGTMGMNQYMRYNRIINQTNELVAALQLTRSEAIKNGGHTYICISSNGTSCDATTATNWHAGWIVFSDPEGNAVDSTTGNWTSTPPTGNDVILRVGQPITGGTTVRTVNFAPAGFVRFGGSGRTRNAGSFILCDIENDETRARAINIALTGLVSVGTDTDTTPNRIVDLTDGTDVTCP